MHLFLLGTVDCGAGARTGSQTGCWIRRNYFLNLLSANTEHLWISEVVPGVSWASGTTSRLVLCPTLTEDEENNDRVGEGRVDGGGRGGGAGGGIR